MKRPWIGTSFKMNKTRAEARAFAEALRRSDLARDDAVRLFVIPPFTAIADVAAVLEGTKIRVGAQNLHWAEAGAWTGEISARMLLDVGATLAEIGHSERRTFFGETDDTVALKTATAVASGMNALVCVGDTRAQYEAGETGAVLTRQVAAALSRIDPRQAGQVGIAYEPVWSIGEGGTPADPAFADAQHGLIKAVTRERVGAELDVLYGGSVNQENCAALAAMPHVDGLFIGRAAWDPAGFLGIVASVTAAMRG